MSRLSRIGKIGCNCVTLAGIGAVYLSSMMYLEGAMGVFQGSSYLKNVNKIKELEIVDDRAIKRHFGGS